MTPDHSGGGARRIQQDALERPSVPEALRIAHIRLDQARGAPEASQVLAHPAEPHRVDVERGDIGALTEKLEQVTGLAARGGTSIEHAHARERFEKWRGEL